jgi:HAD superfamily hydrolase (TIGR01549 family)
MMQDGRLMNIDTIDGILFDVDGTLAHNGHHWKTAIRASTAEHGICLDETQILSFFGKSMEAALQMIGITDERLIYAVRETRNAILADLFRHETPLCEGVMDLCDHLALDEKSMGIVTNSPAAIMQPFLDGKPELARHMKTTVFSSGKPEPEGILHAALSLHIEPVRLGFIGDTLADFHACHNARVGLFMLMRGQYTDVHEDYQPSFSTFGQVLDYCRGN